MTPTPEYRKTRVVIDAAQLDVLIANLRAQGYEVIGPTVADGAIVYAPLSGAGELPAGVTDVQGPGSYRLEKNGTALFAHVVGPHAWKRYLYPPEQLLFRSVRQGRNLRINEELELKRYAFLGVRPCDIAAIRIHDKVFADGEYADPGYSARRQAAFIVAVNCTRPAATCFCASMNTGPRARDGFDLALTEFSDRGAPEFLVEVGSARGSQTLAKLKHRPAGEDDLKRADALLAAAARSMSRSMPSGIADAIEDHLEDAYWDKIAGRCINCANCTMVCPTCFCTTVEDVTDLSGDIAERWRKWDSCFNIDFSYIHGGSVRREASSRFRQWMRHKLDTWHDQFATSGCVGCGRCITWCPVGIDITEEARTLTKG